MACDTPARIAIVGAGPVGIEAALYARFLGYEAAVFEKGRLAENVAAMGERCLELPFSALCSNLGLAAIESQDDVFAPAPADELLSAAAWINGYLAPLAATDLLEGCLRLETEVLHIASLFGAGETPDAEDREPDEWAIDRFRLEVQSNDSALNHYDAAIVIDTAGLPVDAQPHFYRLGRAGTRSERVSFAESLRQIRDLFSIIGGRESLDLYSSAAGLLKKR